MNLALMRRHTKAFIDVNPTELVLTPRDRVRKPAGGWVWEEQAARPAITCTIVENNGIAGNPGPELTVDGVVRTVEMEIVFEWGAPVARYDVFTFQGKDFEVIDLFLDNKYETRAWVSGRG